MKINGDSGMVAKTRCNNTTVLKDSDGRRPTAYLLILCIVVFLSATSPCYAGEVTDEQIVKAIISEAIGESKEGIIAVAYTFKTRLEKGMNLGSVGYQRKDIDEFIARQPKWKVRMIEDIWRDVKYRRIKNPVVGAIYFENVEAFGKPKFCKVLVKKIGNHSFYY